MCVQQLLGCRRVQLGFPEPMRHEVARCGLACPGAERVTFPSTYCVLTVYVPSNYFRSNTEFLYNISFATYKISNKVAVTWTTTLNPVEFSIILEDLELISALYRHP